MRHHLRLPFIVALGLALCPSIQADDGTTAKADVARIAEKAGLGSWDAVTVIKFTIQVDRDGKQEKRTWTWGPKSHQVTLEEAGQEPVTYNRSNLTDGVQKFDGQFVNDERWLLLPFHLVWDAGTTLTKSPESEPAPISGEPMSMLTIAYPQVGGDSYDVFYDDAYVVQGIHFSAGPSAMVTTWENVKAFEGLQLSLDRNMPSGDKITFTDVYVKTVE